MPVSQFALAFSQKPLNDKAFINLQFYQVNIFSAKSIKKLQAMRLTAKSFNNGKYDVVLICYIADTSILAIMDVTDADEQTVQLSPVNTTHCFFYRYTTKITINLPYTVSSTPAFFLVFFNLVLLFISVWLWVLD